MDDLNQKLRQLGQAAETAVPSVSVDEVHDRAHSDGQPIDAGTGVRVHAGAAPARRRLPRGVLVAAAAALVIVGASISFLGTTSDDTPVQIASAMQTRTDFSTPSDDNGWEALRYCESNGDYETDTGNTFYGAYQFTRPSWRSTLTDLGIDHQTRVSPAEASPMFQDAIANALYNAEGADPWPVCGANLTGPMITPVVPQWMQQPGWPRGGIAVFLDPLVDEATQDRVRAQIVELAESTGVPLVFVDKEAAFAEFQMMFAANDELSGSVQVADMPPRFELGGSVAPDVLTQLSRLPGVFEVIASPSSDQAPVRISIPAIGLETPVYPSASVADLQQGAAAIVNEGQMLAIGGFGSVPGSVFERLDELRDGDVIIVTSLVELDGSRAEMVRRFAVSLGDETNAPEPADLQSIDPLQIAGLAQLVLVADVEGDPLQRLVITTTAVGPDPDAYVVAPTD